MVKTITKRTKNKNERENVVTKTASTNMITLKTKLIIKVKNEVEKKIKKNIKR